MCSGPDGQPVWSFCTKPVAMNMSRRRLSRVFTPQTCAFSHLRVHPHRLPICIMPLLLLGFSCGLSMQPAAVSTPRAPAASTPPGRREVLAGAGAAAAFALFGLPSSAQASYALYQASQDSYTDRKKTGFVPVATSDKETLRAIQQDLYDRKAQYRAVKAKKKPAQCCARSSTSWPSLRPTGAPVASLGARPRPRRPRSGPGQPWPLGRSGDTGRPPASSDSHSESGLREKNAHRDTRMGRGEIAANPRALPSGHHEFGPRFRRQAQRRSDPTPTPNPTPIRTF